MDSRALLPWAFRTLTALMGYKNFSFDSSLLSETLTYKHFGAFKICDRQTPAVRVKAWINFSKQDKTCAEFLTIDMGMHLHT
jgi:hypothetical protein